MQIRDQRTKLPTRAHFQLAGPLDKKLIWEGGLQTQPPPISPQRLVLAKKFLQIRIPRRKVPTGHNYKAALH